MVLQLAAQHSLEIQPLRKDVVSAIEAFVADRPNAGYVQIETGDVSRLLFLLQGKTFCAGTFHQQRCGAVPIKAFFAGLDAADSATLHSTDLPLFLCTAVMFRKAPAAQIPADEVDSESLMQQMRELAKDAVLVIRRGTNRSMVFCREGAPQVLYPAPDVSIPYGDSLNDRVMEYIYADESNTTLYLYDEVRLPPAPDAGKTLRTYMRRETAGAYSSLVAVLGGRVVFRYPILADIISVGRGAGNDLSLDNLSISRSHARITRRGKKLRFEDLGSENGLRYGGRRVAKVEIGIGDRVEVGKYTLIHQRLPAGAVVPEAMPTPPSEPSTDETIAISPYDKVGEIEHGGERIRLTGLVFTIGKHADANLRIKGFLVAPRHAQIHRHRSGAYVIEHLAGHHPVKINGEEIERVQLNNGDEISIGSQTMRFLLVDV